MTPKEKAFEIAHKYRLLEIRTSENSHMMISMECAKLCALIAVDEIIKSNPYEVSKTDMDSTIEYWQEVKKEIYKL